jgi:predicted glycoside hydrolase/deacetylase ChbG (UPF0249 family)
MSRLLVVNADDFGLSHGVNEGILRGHRDGIVTSASLMVEERAAAEAASAAKDHPRLSVGLHFVERRGVDLDDPAGLTQELDRQLRLFRALMGRNPTHLDSHHHVHGEGARTEAFSKQARELGVPLRGDGFASYIGGFYAQWDPGKTDLRHVSLDFLDWLLREEVGKGVTELLCHPAVSIDDLNSEYATERLAEFRTLTAPRLRAKVEKLGIRLVNFAEAQRESAYEARTAA